MVQVSLTPHRGNSSRAFPFSGVLGLTPVVVQGTARIQLDEDGRPLPDAFGVVVRVRCYEGDSNIGASSSKVRLLYEMADTIWSPPGGSKMAPVGELERNFRLTVPKDAMECGAVSMLSFRSFRVFWTVDIVVNHKPTSLYGDRLRKSYPLFLVNHAIPRSHLPSAPAWTGRSGHIDYHVSAKNVCSAGDSLPLDIRLTPSNSESTPPIRKAVFEVRRIIDRCDRAAITVATPPSTSPTHPVHVLTLRHGRHSSSSSTRPVVAISPMAYSPLKSDDSDISEGYFGLPAHPPSDTSDSSPELEAARPGWRRDDQTVMSATLEPESLVLEGGHWTGTLAAAVPATKTAYHYSIGETCSTPSLRIRAYLGGKVRQTWLRLADRLQITLRNKSVIELAPQEVYLCPTSSADRATSKAKVGKILALQAAEVRLFSSPTVAVSDVPHAFGTKRPGDGESSARPKSPRRASDSPEAPRSPTRLSRAIAGSDRVRATSLCIEPGGSLLSHAPVHVDLPAASTTRPGRSGLAMISSIEGSSESDDEDDEVDDKPAPEPTLNLFGPVSFSNFSLTSPSRPTTAERAIAPHQRSGSHSRTPSVEMHARKPSGEMHRSPPALATLPSSPPLAPPSIPAPQRRKSSSGLRFLNDALRLGRTTSAHA